MNHTCESVDVDVPTPSLLPGVHVGIVPGAPGADEFWAGAVSAAGNADNKRRTMRTNSLARFAHISVTLLVRPLTETTLESLYGKYL